MGKGEQVGRMPPRLAVAADGRPEQIGQRRAASALPGIQRAVPPDQHRSVAVPVQHQQVGSADPVAGPQQRRPDRGRTVGGQHLGPEVDRPGKLDHDRPRSAQLDAHPVTMLGQIGPALDQSGIGRPPGGRIQIRVEIEMDAPTAATGDRRAEAHGGGRAQLAMGVRRHHRSG